MECLAPNVFLPAKGIHPTRFSSQAQIPFRVAPLISSSSHADPYRCATITARKGISSVPALLVEESQIPVRK